MARGYYGDMDEGCDTMSERLAGYSSSSKRGRAVEEE
jgi:hypothetical protein